MQQTKFAEYILALDSDLFIFFFFNEKLEKYFSLFWRVSLNFSDVYHELDFKVVRSFTYYVTQKIAILPLSPLTKFV